MLAIAPTLVMLCGLFQVFDGTQAAAAGNGSGKADTHGSGPVPGSFVLDYAPSIESDKIVQIPARHELFIGGKWTPPVKGQYFDDICPITGKAFTKVARSTAEDIELALDAAHAAIHKIKTHKTTVLKGCGLLMVKIGEFGLNVSDIAKQPIHDVDPVTELREQGAPIKLLSAFPVARFVITVIAVPITIQLYHVNVPNYLFFHHFF